MSGLTAITQQEIELVSRFVALLQKECEALQRAEVGTLPEIAGEKTPLIEQLNTLEMKRGQLLKAGPGENVSAAMSRWLEANPKEQQIAADWKKLLDLAREAKRLNTLNSGLVKMHLNHAGEMLDVLTQQARQQALYGSNGQASQLSGSRIVDSA